MKPIMLGLAVAAALASPAAAAPKEKPTGQYGEQSKAMPKSEQAFLVDAAVSNLTEVKLGQLAEQQSENQAVKELARTLVNDHQKANESLQQIFTDQQIAFPQTVSGVHAQTFEKLSQAPKATFDRHFLNEVVEEHTRDVKSYRAWEAKAQQKAVKNYLKETLPRLEDHLKTARQVEKQLGLTPKA